MLSLLAVTRSELHGGACQLRHCMPVSLAIDSSASDDSHLLFCRKSLGVSVSVFVVKGVV